MAFEISVDAAHLRDRVRVFMADHVFPMEEEWDGLLEAGGDRWQPVAKMEELKGASDQIPEAIGGILAEMREALDEL